MSKLSTLKYHPYEIGFSYEYEVDGEPCEDTGEIICDFTDAQVKLGEDSRGEWDNILTYLISEYGDECIPHEEISNLTWEYARKIDKRTKEGRDYLKSLERKVA